MFRTYRVGTIAGFPIEVNVSFIVMLGVFLFWLGPITGLLFVALAFGSVLLHELGHALVARHLGVRVVGIELSFFGGAAKISGQPKSAGDEIAIAAAGPAVSFALGGLGLMLAAGTGPGMFSMFGWLNVVIAVFNLLPALPMDGGRIFRALLSKHMSHLRATEISVYVARGLAIALGVVGLATLHVYFVLLAVVLWFMGSAELHVARMAAGHRFDGVEVMPRGYALGRERTAQPRAGFHRPRASGGFVVRQRNGRLVVEFLD